MKRDSKPTHASSREVSDEVRLERFQGALLAALADAQSPEEVRKALASFRDRTELAPWIDALDERAVEVGQKLVRRWGERVVRVPRGKMRAPTFVGPGRALEDRVVPIPQPGPGEVRIRVHASGVCGTDAHMMRGEFRVPVPVVPGHEPVGVVDALGAGVTTFDVGDRVGAAWVQGGCDRCDACARQEPKYCATPRTWVATGGGHAPFMLADARGCARIPDGIDFAHAAPLFCAGFTAMSAYRRARPRPGDRIAVFGIGGLGHLAIQIAKSFGHEVVAVTRTETKRDDARALGADEVLVPREHAGAELRAIGGADVVLATSSDLAGTSDVAWGLRPEGRLVVAGLPRGPTRALEVDPQLMLERQLSIVGAMQDVRADLVDVLDLCARGRVVPRLELYPVTQIARALARLDEGRVRYRAVIVHG